MSTSGIAGWNPSTSSIIRGALRLLSAIAQGETPGDGEYQEALDALNGMVKTWQASGIHVWAEEDCTLFLQPGQVRYLLGTGATDAATISSQWVQGWLTATAVGGAAQIGAASVAAIAAGDRIGIWLDAGTIFWTGVVAVVGDSVSLAAPLPSQASSGAQLVAYATPLVRPLRVPGARRYQFAPPGGQAIEVPVVPMSRLDYANVPNKTTPGTVTQFFYDPQLGAGVMHVWPAPSDSRSALAFTAQRPLQDFTSQADTADLPQEWISVLRYNLAREMAPEYDCPPQRFAMIAALAAEKLALAQAWDREPQSVLFGAGAGPAGRSG
ncbi:hypothetical protein AA13595_2880 [Gluconacetobacter johannae DSM 13595]|uniref:Uncharacterized protein n=1 Tax=Gluconacetobacter johannae TaxID=112140 RepID=A0A7W4P6I6_9PROT|nr:hypothetical protein [Gluconacetobacter johannae]MBB2177298.1 hypothetical protein [Gluconacetobacter johannae]GBQ90390.1 hypothetical protein AA13595_2880 [Gluconacetobacter johannae DSM 13595]